MQKASSIPIKIFGWNPCLASSNNEDPAVPDVIATSLTFMRLAKGTSVLHRDIFGSRKLQVQTSNSVGNCVLARDASYCPTLKGNLV